MRYSRPPSDAARNDGVVSSFLGFVAAAAFLVGIVLLSPELAFAAEPGNASRRQAEAGTPPACDCRSATGPVSDASPTVPGGDLRASLDQYDQLAVVQAIHVALNDVGDGASYVWHRSHGRLSGIVQMNNSYRNGRSLCRRMTVVLTAGTDTRHVVTAACRLADRSWQIIGS